MIVRNTLFNLFGLGLPLVVAVFTIPPLIEALGTSKFGLLTLIWAIVSYFGLFDLGLGRALTLQISVAESRGEFNKIGSTVATALVFMAGLGVSVGVLVILGAQAGIDLLADVPDRKEAIAALMAMGIAIPAITLTSGFRGMLEARHAFGIVNLIRLPMGIFTFAGPLAAVWLAEPRLDLIAWVLVLGRYIGLAAHAWFAMRILPPDSGALRYRSDFVKPLFSIGGWLTVSNIVSPLMGYADRFIIGALVSATAVAYYATPYEIVTKLWIVPGALTSVLFPTFAAQIAKDAASGIRLFRQSLVTLVIVLLPVCAGLAIFSHDILRLWINPEFADNSALLLQIFALGVLVNSTAHIPYTLIQGSGRPKWTAAIHLAEAVPFLLVLWLATSEYGAIGAALAWLVRIAIDTILMFIASGKIQGARLASLFPSHAIILIAGSLAAVIMVNAAGVLIKIAAFGLIILGCALAALRLFRTIKRR